MTKIEERVLRYVNRLRKEHKIGRPLKRLRKGEIGDWSGCTIARSLTSKSTAAGVTMSRIDIGPPKEAGSVFGGPRIFGRTTTTPPKYVGDFIDRFDEGKLPHLEK